MKKILNVILSRYTLATRRINSIKQMSMLRISGSKYYIWTQFVLVLLLATQALANTDVFSFGGEAHFRCGWEGVDHLLIQVIFLCSQHTTTNDPRKFRR